MAKKKIEEPLYVEASLKISKNQFVDMLADQIRKGEELLKVEVPQLRRNNGYGGGFMYAPRSVDHVDYDENTKKKFIADFNRWDTFNDELYKTSFDAPNSTYRHEYEQEKWTIFGTDIIKEYKEEIQRLNNHMTGDIERVSLIPCLTIEEMEHVETSKETPQSNKIFIVHGHDVDTRNDVELFVRSIGYEPIILCKRADMGNTIIEKIEREAKDVCFAIVIYTYCDDGKSKEEADLKPRARQNVVFEHGFMCSHLGRARVCALLESGVEQPGDLQGVIYKSLDATGMWKYDVAREMIAAGLKVDMNKIA